MWFIKHPLFGYFIGEFHGMAIFEHHLREGSMAIPRIFATKEEASKHIASWHFGAMGCAVTDEMPDCYIRGIAA